MYRGEKMFIYPLLSFSLSTFTDRLVGQSPGPDVKQVEFWNMRHMFFLSVSLCLSVFFFACVYVCACLFLCVKLCLCWGHLSCHFLCLCLFCVVWLWICLYLCLFCAFVSGRTSVWLCICVCAGSKLWWLKANLCGHKDKDHLYLVSFPYQLPFQVGEPV